MLNFSKFRSSRLPEAQDGKMYKMGVSEVLLETSLLE